VRRSWSLRSTMPESACMPNPVKVTSLEHRAITRLKSWLPSGLERTSLGPSPVWLVPPGLGGQVRVVGVGPSEWLLVSDQIRGPELEEQVERHTAGDGLAVVDLSCAFKVVRVEGSASRVLLSKGCGLDFHPEVFPAARSTRTRFAQLSVIIDCIDPTPRFDLYVGRSYFSYLCSWLTDAAAEFSHIAAS
jgi:heterotetrameric sarcosine oxidase gamma subunit